MSLLNLFKLDNNNNNSDMVSEIFGKTVKRRRYSVTRINALTNLDKLEEKDVQFINKLLRSKKNTRYAIMLYKEMYKQETSYGHIITFIANKSMAILWHLQNRKEIK